MKRSAGYTLLDHRKNKDTLKQLDKHPLEYKH
jgi:hypothetical protein